MYMELNYNEFTSQVIIDLFMTTTLPWFLSYCCSLSNSHCGTFALKSQANILQLHQEVINPTLRIVGVLKKFLDKAHFNAPPPLSPSLFFTCLIMPL